MTQAVKLMSAAVAAEHGDIAAAALQTGHGWPVGWSVEVDGLDAAGWNAVVAGFSDANVYQTWAYEEVRSGRAAMSHLVVRLDDEIVAATQLRIVKLPWLPCGVAYARWGPLWQPRGRRADPNILRYALRALRQEYAVRRGLALRVLPLAFDSERSAVEPQFTAEHFAHLPEEGAQRTLLICLDRPLEDLRKGLDQKWRNGLNRAEKNGLIVKAGTDEELFDAFINLYHEMHQRKRFHETSSADEFHRMQAAQPAGAKLRVAIAWSDGQPAAGVLCSQVGDMGLYLYGATASAGMSSKASYLLQWQTIAWLKSRGARWYNLHGINPLTNPGTYHFKAGLSGKNGQDLRYVGVYEACADGFTRRLLRAGLAARRAYRQIRALLHPAKSGATEAA